MTLITLPKCWEHTLKVYIEPVLSKKHAQANGGIKRVLDAQLKYLPRFDVEVTRKIDEADLTVGHVDHLPIVQDKPFISHNHGLMWTDYFNEGHNYEVNRSITSALVQADAITAPSHWVAQAISYGLLRTPQVVYHGVDLDEWQVTDEPGNYVLWNKARADAVSNSQDMLTLADKMPNVQFVSTLGNQKSNLKICGVMDYAAHKSVIQNAGVYLATARETFGIGTLEALACGVPVAGWDYGGQSEIILQGETGYLAPYGNYAALIECVNKCFADRTRLSVNARADIIARWQWDDQIEQYANLYKMTLENWSKPRSKVSVIVPCHNLAKYLPDALKSLIRQSMTDWECFIIDDVSTDNTFEIGKDFEKQFLNFHYYRTPENIKLSRALNFGFAQAQGKYILNLDADNVLPDNALEILSDALDQRRDLHIVYGALETMSDDGTNRKANQFPYPVYENYSWNAQLAHLNQLHSGAMMRREVVEQSAGYRERQWRAEDAEFWSRVSSFGFRIERVTDQPTLVYRWRQGSKSSEERTLDPIGIDGDWCEYFPWRTARNAEDGNKVIAQNPQSIANVQLVPFGAQGKRTDKPFWNVYHRQEPLVSVIIPVGNGHQRYLNDALDSLVGQMTNEWEAIVVNDTDEEWEIVRGAPYARVICNHGQHGAGIARNLGLKYAKGQLVFFLDADDMLHPNALIEMVRRYAQGDVGYVYCDASVPESQLKNKVVAAPEFTQDGWLKRGIHSQAILMATEDAKRIGFDESMFAWEDWDFFIRCIANGICGIRVGEPLLLYRKHLGNRSAFGNEKRAELFAELKAKYHEYTTGAKSMAKCGGCGSHKVLDAIRRSSVMQSKVESPDKPIQPGYVRLRYTGPRTAPVTYYANKHPYQAANTQKWRLLDVPSVDVDALKAMGVFMDVPVRPIAQIVLPPAVSSLPIVEKPVEQKPEPLPIASPPKTITAETMQQMVKALEEKTGERIQPAVLQSKPIEPLAPKLIESKKYKPRSKKK